MLFSCTSAKRLRPRFQEHDGVVRVNVKRHCPRRRQTRQMLVAHPALPFIFRRSLPQALCAGSPLRPIFNPQPEIML